MSAGEVEAVVRHANRHIRDFAAGFHGPAAVWEFFCECGCFELVELTLAEFDAGVPVYAPGHAEHSHAEPEVLAAMHRRRAAKRPAKGL